MTTLLKINEYNEQNKKFKVTSTTNDKGVTNYFCNNILVATKTRYGDWFHSYDKKTGRESNLRDIQKFAYICKWNEGGLKQIFGNVSFKIDNWSVDDGFFRDKKRPDFQNFSPNYHHGDVGNHFNNSYIKEVLQHFYNKIK